MRDQKPFRSLQSGHKVQEFEILEVNDPKLIESHLVIGVVNRGGRGVVAKLRLEQIL
jgi:hypothetical protein